MGVEYIYLIYYKNYEYNFYQILYLFSTNLNYTVSSSLKVQWNRLDIAVRCVNSSHLGRLRNRYGKIMSISLSNKR